MFPPEKETGRQEMPTQSRAGGSFIAFVPAVVRLARFRGIHLPVGFVLATGLVGSQAVSGSKRRSPEFGA